MSTNLKFKYNGRMHKHAQRMLRAQRRTEALSRNTECNAHRRNACGHIHGLGVGCNGRWMEATPTELRASHWIDISRKPEPEDSFYRRGSSYREKLTVDTPDDV